MKPLHLDAKITIYTCYFRHRPFCNETSWVCSATLELGLCWVGVGLGLVWGWVGVGLWLGWGWGWVGVGLGMGWGWVGVGVGLGFNHKNPLICSKFE